MHENIMLLNSLVVACPCRIVAIKEIKHQSHFMSSVALCFTGVRVQMPKRIRKKPNCTRQCVTAVVPPMWHCKRQRGNTYVVTIDSVSMLYAEQ